MAATAPVPAEIWGESEAIIKLKARLSRAARVNRPVLILGERGSGKELAAARLHFLSPRWKAPYLTLNCAALNANLLESELFGHEAGAYTGAARGSPGRFEAADGGSLFLDEISHLSLEAQAKILRVVEYGFFQRVGSVKERRVDVRLISASNVDLWRRAEDGAFLPDLLDRLSFEVITIPPLRERAGDIRLLAHLFAARMAQELGQSQAPAFSSDALELLEKYRWPGNVRELKNTVERAVYQSGEALISSAALDFLAASAASEAAEPAEAIIWPLPLGRFDQLLAGFGLELMRQALQRARFNQKEAAALLGLSYHRFRFLKKKYEAVEGGGAEG